MVRSTTRTYPIFAIGGITLALVWFAVNARLWLDRESPQSRSARVNDESAAELPAVAPVSPTPPPESAGSNRRVEARPAAAVSARPAQPSVNTVATVSSSAPQYDHPYDHAVDDQVAMVAPDVHVSEAKWRPRAAPAASASAQGTIQQR
jgi:hypothetical protein